VDSKGIRKSQIDEGHSESYGSDTSSDVFKTCMDMENEDFEQEGRASSMVLRQGSILNQHIRKEVEEPALLLRHQSSHHDDEY
jgi:hypothetical protein